MQKSTAITLVVVSVLLVLFGVWTFEGTSVPEQREEEPKAGTETAMRFLERHEDIADASDTSMNSASPPDVTDATSVD